MIPFEKGALVLNQAELIARLGGAKTPNTLLAARAAEDEIRGVLDCKYCFKETAVTVSGYIVDLGFATVKSADLAALLKGSKHAYVFAASIGHSVDRLIRAKATTKVSAQFITDAVASAFIESLCDSAEALLPKKTTRRFSPGYGDLSLELQTPIIEFLTKYVGCEIRLSSSGLMIPSKSVTAIMGII